MKKYFVSTVLGLCLTVPVVSQGEGLQTFEEKLSYSMGFEVGSYFKAAGGDIKKDLLVSGIEAAYNGDKPLLTDEEMLAVKKEYAEKMQKQQMAQLEEMKAANLAAGVAFLEENKKKSGVMVTESGLQYEVIKEGTGDKATAEDTVKVEYVGTLIDGTEFDSTAKHGEPAEFQVGQVIKGWAEALQMMNAGSKLRLAIPSDLAYGEQGAAPRIQPNSVLVFDVELLEIVKK
ncbi:FKBP-type peptidyl-prolyl cis-trans isomerase [Desulforhopalus sp. IMCC35007]|uniref:FKBP-type peptidyl-prolyl cis-trans isomerase n=1 Tax=Desulforhopalus sp. IMCC35007 TaxID=2569543 RepID=UPI0010ADC71E|nr:FKBP-type peptidyl-prolyl cis-trans isomerase [Desulforhopalus sp. IMCC35007]TKB08813.1 FKBP-type peptidyl-prolyl cis-trans isomerase [Desulforhopalus sp. IMCC35007]